MENKNHIHKVIPTGNIGNSSAKYLSLIPFEIKQESPTGNTGQGSNSKPFVPSSIPAYIQLTERGLKQ